MKYSPGERWISVSTEARDGRVGVRVEDRGAGIAPEHHGRIFEEFYRVEEGRSEGGATGSGLGLAIVRHIMEGHGGSVELESAVGKGSAFTLWFPKEGSDETYPAG
jgi:signal transduction histidine kinase